MDSDTVTPEEKREYQRKWKQEQLWNDTEYAQRQRAAQRVYHATKRGSCIWCSHSKNLHDGRVDPQVREHNPWVRWTKSACSRRRCICRRYETSGN